MGAPYNSTQCGANFTHKPAVLIPGTRTVCALATFHALHRAISPITISAVGIQSRTIQVKLSVTVFLFCLLLLTFAQFYEVVGCWYVTSLAMAWTTSL